MITILILCVSSFSLYWLLKPPVTKAEIEKIRNERQVIDEASNSEKQHLNVIVNK